ncbi:MAG: hypothetical protein K8S27_02960 [Candidatus Omnitrophica bacterium]|nr:hypothetical protein [Candidatus Omnitrophota bacterium]
MYKTTTKQKIVLILFGLLLGLLLLELLLRLGGFIFSLSQDYRNTAALQKQDTYRILCLGESTTALGGENSYPCQLERILNQRVKDISVKVINKGVPATDTANILNVLENNIEKYRPDIVITMMGINDRPSTMTYENISTKKTAVSLGSLRLVKFAKFFHSIISERKIKQTLDVYERKKRKYLEEKLFALDKSSDERALELEKAIRINFNSYGIQETKRVFETYESFIEPVNYYSKTQENTDKREKLLRKVEMIFKDAIAQNAENYLAYLGLYDIYRKQGRGAQSEEMLIKTRNGFKKFLEENPSDDSARLTLFEIYLLKDEGELAEQVLQNSGMLLERSKSGPQSLEIWTAYAQAYFTLADYYMDYGKAARSDRMFGKARRIAAIVLNQAQDDDLYLQLSYAYLDRRDHDMFHETVQKCLELNPANDDAYLVLEKYYEVMANLDKAEEMLLACLKHHPVHGQAYTRLGRHYRLYGKYHLAEQMLKKALDIDPSNEFAYDEMTAFLYRKKLKRLRQENQGYQGNDWVGFGGYHVSTIHNYRKLQEVLSEKGIPLFCLQYPTLSVKPLKDIFKDREGIIFVDNEDLFNEAVAAEGYDKYFIDRFAGYFGHCTVMGDKLLAKNVADIIIQEYFNNR